VLLAGYKIIAALLVFLASIAVIYPLRKKHAFKHAESIGLGEALASGIFLGAAFFHMLPDAITRFNQIDIHTTYPIPEAICVLGFLLLLFLERLSFIRCPDQPQKYLPYLLVFTLIIHAFTEGAALGLGGTLSETLMLFIAIIAHKSSESFALCVSLLRHELSLNRITSIIIFFSIMTPAGIALGTAIDTYALGTNGQLIAASFNAFAAGTFLYISTLHHVHFHKHSKDPQSMMEFCCLALGLAAMAMVALLGS
jgi:zinc transporter ZupT